MVLRARLLAVLVVLWMAAVVGVGRWLLAAETVPGVGSACQADWPGDSRLPRTAGRWTLVVFAHPHCSCVQATFEELNGLLARTHARLEVVVAFVAPPGAPVGWERSGNWHRAATLPGVRVVGDRDGVEARRFDAATSGQVFLFDPDGRLGFRGGLASARGHGGDSPGRRAILAGVAGTGSGDPAESPVFGCPLLAGGAEN